MRTVFTSNISFEDAAQRAMNEGWKVVGTAQNPRGQFVVFGERAESNGSRTSQSERNTTIWRNAASNIKSKIWQVIYMSNVQSNVLALDDDYEEQMELFRKRRKRILKKKKKLYRSI